METRIKTSKLQTPISKQISNSKLQTETGKRRIREFGFGPEIAGFGFGIWVLGFCTCSPSISAADLTPAQTQFFESKIRPVLVNNCYKCHSQQSEKVKGG